MNKEVSKLSEVDKREYDTGYQQGLIIGVKHRHNGGGLGIDLSNYPKVYKEGFQNGYTDGITNWEDWCIIKSKPSNNIEVPPYRTVSENFKPSGKRSNFKRKIMSIFGFIKRIFIWFSIIRLV